MKRIYLSILALMSSLGVIYAQGEMDVYKMSQRELTGTARSVGMGGAFGALGGDISGIAVNPAGIGIYSSSEIVTTLNFQNTKVENEFGVDKFDEGKFKFRFDNLAFVTGIDLNSDIVPRLNVGFSYNKLKSFDRKYKAIGRGSSLTDYMAARATNGGYTAADLKSQYKWDYDWLAVLGQNSFLIDPITPGSNEFISSRIGYNYNLEADNSLFVREKGSVNSYDFNIGTTISDMLSIGLTLSVTDMDYEMYSVYTEEFYNPASEGANWRGGFDQFNRLKTEGTGLQVGLGLIFKPINALRFGVAYHSPTWYDMTDHYQSGIDQNLESLIPDSNFEIPNDYKSGYIESPLGTYDYKMTTPDRWTFSAAGIIGNMAIISVDYELSDYRNMRLKDYTWDGYDINMANPKQYIKEDFKTASTVRVGAEIKPIPQFSIRAGYSFQESPLKKSFRNNETEVMVMGPIAHYTLDGHINSYTYGLGYRFTKNFYTDVAFVYRTQNSYLYNIPLMGFDNEENPIEGSQNKMKTTAFQGLLTFGFKF